VCNVPRPRKNLLEERKGKEPEAADVLTSMFGDGKGRDGGGGKSDRKKAGGMANGNR